MADKVLARTMEFKDFTAAVEEALIEKYPDYEIKVESVNKNNGTHLTGIIVRPKDKAVGSVLYMEPFYRKYLTGCALYENAMEDVISDVISDMIQFYENTKVQTELEIPDIADFEAVKDKICFKLINKDHNSRYLEGIPYRQFLDLAVIYYVPVSVPGDKIGHMKVTDQMLGLWKVDEETLYVHAVENTKRFFPVELCPMEEVINEILSKTDGNEELTPSGSMEMSGLGYKPHILRCGTENEVSASAMLYHSVLQEFAKEYGGFYILPASIYEVILVPMNLDEELSKFYCIMVKRINESGLSHDEVLSDNVYYYHADTGRIEMFSSSDGE